MVENVKCGRDAGSEKQRLAAEQLLATAKRMMRICKPKQSDQNLELSTVGNIFVLCTVPT